MTTDLAAKTRRENPILEAVFDELKAIVDYTEVSLYKVEGDCFTLVTYRGPVPQAEALSLSFTASAMDGWHRAVESGAATISEDSRDALQVVAQARRPFEELLGVSPAMRPQSQITVPLGERGSIVYVLGLGHVEPRRYTPETGEQVALFARDHMPAIEASVRYADMAHRAAEAEILLSAQQAMGARLELGEVQRMIADEARRVAFARSAFILTLEHEDLVLEAFSGEEGFLSAAGRRWPVAGAAIAALLEPLSSRRDDPARFVSPEVAHSLATRDWLAAPLRLGGQVIGLIVVLDKRLGTFGPPDEHRLAVLASAAGICLDNARLYMQARRVAALEERDRLSREMHDELAQALGYLKMQASVIDLRLAAGDLATAWAGLGEMTRVLDVTYATVREAIFGLRHPVATGKGFFAFLPSYLADYRMVYGMDVSLELAVDPPPELDAEVELQLARIVQEALTNVRRHAAARRAWVQAARCPDGIIVRIGDDGRGFDAEAVLARERQCFGLQIMRERAGSFRGRLEIRSVPGEGTEVSVLIPGA